MKAIDGDALLKRVQQEKIQAQAHGREFSTCFMSSGGTPSTEWWFVEDLIENSPTIEPERKWKTCFDCPLAHGCPKIRGCTNEQAEKYASDIPDDCPLSIEPEPCEYCHEDSDGYVKPVEKNCHAFIRFGMDGWELSLKANGWHGSTKIRYCPMCGRKLEK